MFVHRPGSVQSSISVGNVTVKRDDPRWFMLQLANQIYGGAFDSRLVRNIREEKGYTYSPQSQFAAFGDTGVYRAVADVRNDVTGATLKEIYAEMDGLRAAPPGGAGARRRQGLRARAVRDPERDPERPGRDAQHREHVRPAGRLSRDLSRRG